MRIWLLLWVTVTAWGSPKIGLKKVIDAGLIKPVAVETAPKDAGSLYIVEQRGVIRRWKQGKASVFLDIVGRVKSGGERGLLSVAFHPNYPKNKRYFVNYTAAKFKRSKQLITVIAEYRAGSPKETRVLTFDQPYVNHNGGQLAFGPDGYLYIATGDGGYFGDPKNHGQNKKTLLGKILRIDVDRKEGKNNYAIPKDNPFKKGLKQEIYAYGLRNPWRFSFDPVTKRLFAADVGQNDWEEVNVIEKNGNYGWRFREGKHCYLPKESCPTQEPGSQKGLIEPIFEYPQPEGLSITGGYVYRGKRLPQLSGAYVFGDYVSGKIWAIKEVAGPGSAWKVIWSDVPEPQVPISSFGVDNAGELLIVSHNGPIYQLDRLAKP